MRRNDYDVTDSIRTTYPGAESAGVIRIYQALYDTASTYALERPFRASPALYRRKHPEYHGCDTEYHDIQHVLDVTLAMARLLDGYERSRKGDARLPHQVFTPRAPG